VTSPLDVAAVRQQFPALAIADHGKARAYLDNPAGTQVPSQVIDRTVRALRDVNANLGGHFVTTRGAGQLVDEAHAAMADFYNAASPDEIIFGQNMTTLTLHMSRCLARQFQPGDEIVLSRMDHEGNVAPWLLMAEERGLVVRWMDFNTDSYEFPVDALSKVLSSRTRLVAMGMASNCTGTINDVAAFARQAKAAGALVYVDAVQFAPHDRMDVQALGADFVVSSAYKWFGPHMGVMWGRHDVLRETFAYKVRAVGEELPGKFETGTLSHEGMAGCLGAVEYLEQFGTGATRGERLTSAWLAIAAYERVLTLRLIDSIRPFKGLTIRGVTSANAMHRRVPTVSFTVEGVTPVALAKHFATDNMFVWSGHNYALEPIRAMGLENKGGVLRVGLAHYNTAAEVDGFVASLARALD
jgi:cysteine desulfurase family protein (TIGR01976 family)